MRDSRELLGAITLLQSLHRVYRIEISNLYSKVLERLGIWVRVSLTF